MNEKLLEDKEHLEKELERLKLELKNEKESKESLNIAIEELHNKMDYANNQIDLVICVKECKKVINKLWIIPAITILIILCTEPLTLLTVYSIISLIVFPTIIICGVIYITDKIIEKTLSDDILKEMTNNESHPLIALEKNLSQTETNIEEIEKQIEILQENKEIIEDRIKEICNNVSEEYYKNIANIKLEVLKTRTSYPIKNETDFTIQDTNNLLVKKRAKR